MTLPAAVLFDCDGVLVDSEPISIRVIRDDLAGRGLDLSFDEVLDLFLGGTIEGAGVEAVRRGARMPADWPAVIYPKMFAALAREVEAVPGVRDLLNLLEGRAIPCAVGSNGPVAKMEITLNRAGLMHRLAPHIYSARDLGRPKPLPDIYLHAAARLGVEAARCAVVEDSASGARAAQAAGMRCIGFAASGQGARLAPHCDVIATDMPGVARALGLLQE